MTQKELSYVEDAIGHEQNIIKILKQTIEKIQEEKLASFLEEEVTKHTTMLDNLMNLLEVKING